MISELKQKHWVDENGNPAGGSSHGTGFAISWQRGPLGRGDERLEPNGAFVETVISAVVGRIEHYQEGKFESEYNERALFHLNKALAVLNDRTKKREARQVEGTHEK